MSKHLVMVRIEISSGAPTGLRQSPRPVVEHLPCEEQLQRLAGASHEGSLDEATWEDAEWR